MFLKYCSDILSITKIFIYVAIIAATKIIKISIKLDKLCAPKPSQVSQIHTSSDGMTVKIIRLFSWFFLLEINHAGINKTIETKPINMNKTIICGYSYNAFKTGAL